MVFHSLNQPWIFDHLRPLRLEHLRFFLSGLLLQRGRHLPDVGDEPTWARKLRQPQRGPGTRELQGVNDGGL